MRIYFAGNEDVCRHHLPVVQSKANEFAEMTKRRGLQQNTFYLTFDDTGAQAVVSYCFGQLSIGISAPFPPSGGEKEVVERKRLYEWNKIADTGTIAGGQKQVLFSSNAIYFCDFDAGGVGIALGEASLAELQMPDETKAFAGLNGNLPFRFGYPYSTKFPFYLTILCGFQQSFVPVYQGEYLPPYGLFRTDFLTYRPVQYYKGDYIYTQVDSTSYFVSFPTGDVWLSGYNVCWQLLDENDFNFGEDGYPVINNQPANHNLFNAASCSSPFVYSGSGLWSGSNLEPVPSSTAPAGGNLAVWISGETSVEALINEYKSDPDQPESIRLYSSRLSLTANVGILNALNDFEVKTFNFLTDFLVTTPSPSVMDAIRQDTRAPVHYIGGTVVGDNLIDGSFALTMPGYTVTHIRNIAFVRLVADKSYGGGVANGTNNHIIPPDQLTYVFVYEDNDVTMYNFVSHITGYDIVWGQPAILGTGPHAAAMGSAGVSYLEFIGDTYTFFGIKYTAGNEILGIYELKFVGTEARLYEHITFFDRIYEYLQCYTYSICRQMLVWFSEGCELFMVKGSPLSDGVWRKSGTSCTRIISDVSMYSEPVYISRDGSCLAFKDKIFINDILVATPVECVGVFHTHDFYVDKVSTAQFAIKKLDGTTVSVTPDGLYNYYELTDDSSYAMLSKAWVTLPGLEQESRATGNVLIIAFADGPVKFEMADRSLSREVPNRDTRTTSRFLVSGTSYISPLTWCRLFAPGLSTALAYGRQPARTLVSCREDGFAERLYNFAPEERVSAFLWHHKLGLFRRLMNTVTEIPYDVLNTETRTIVKTEE